MLVCIAFSFEGEVLWRDGGLEMMSSGDFPDRHPDPDTVAASSIRCLKAREAIEHRLYQTSHDNISH